MLDTVPLVVLVSVVAALLLAVAWYRTRQKLAALEQRFGPVFDVDAQLVKVRVDLEKAEEQRKSAALQVRAVTDQRDALQAECDGLRGQLRGLEEQAIVVDAGLYTPRFPLGRSELYTLKVTEVREKQKAAVRAERAVILRGTMTSNGSLKEGERIRKRLSNLALRAFNGECDAAVARVRWDNVQTMTTRIQKAFDAINKLIALQEMEMDRAYLQLKLDELHVTFEYEQKLQAEREEQREIRERMREEEKALRQLEKAREEAEKDERRTAAAIEQARRELADATAAEQAKLSAKIASLEDALRAAEERKRTISLAEQTKSGYVYVISNIGSFGEQVYKVGMTRRLDPMERVRELSDASVPFPFDVHALVYTENAPAFEAELHAALEARRVNRVNERKEFFEVALDEIAALVRARKGEIEFTMAAEAAEYRQSVALRQHAAGSMVAA